MNRLTAEIFERFEIRKTKRQKTEFINWVCAEAKRMGYEARVEKGSLGARNIVFGDPDTAKAVYAAHYDTCPALPFPNFLTPRSRLIYVLYQLAIVLVFFAIAFCLGFLSALLGDVLTAAGLDELPALTELTPSLLMFILCLCLLFGPANRHTANDNTSGVTTVLGIMERLPSERRDKVAFVLFDLEESGLIGSSSFFSKHKKAMKDKPLINFDCVSDGKNILFVFRKKARQYTELFARHYPSRGDISTEFLTKGYIYPSDQASFPCGIGVAAFKKKGKLLYMDRIHTKRDTVYDEENIAYLVEKSLEFTEIL